MSERSLEERVLENYKKVFFQIVVLAGIHFFVSKSEAREVPFQNLTYWNPAKTWVFAVGILEYEDSESLSSFPKENRKDQLFINTLLHRGVPQSQIVFIKDQDARRRALQQRFIRFLQKIKNDETMIFYYAGHGAQGHRFEKGLASYDTGIRNTQVWYFQTILKLIRTKAPNIQTILFADACYSGSVCQLASKILKQPFICLASSDSRSTSTANWTFTDMIIDAFSGNGMVDVNHDGRIDVFDLHTHVQEGMAQMEWQISDFKIQGYVPNSFVLSPILKKKAHSWVGKSVLIDGVDLAKIIDYKNAYFLVRYQGYFKDDSWVRASRLKKIPTPQQFVIGQRVWVRSSSTSTWWYPARVLQKLYNLHYVGYEGYSEEENHWVKPENLSAHLD